MVLFVKFVVKSSRTFNIGIPYGLVYAGSVFIFFKSPVFAISRSATRSLGMYCYRDRYRSNSAFRKNSALCDRGIVESCVERFANMVFYFAKNVAVFGT